MWAGRDSAPFAPEIQKAALGTHVNQCQTEQPLPELAQATPDPGSDPQRSCSAQNGPRCHRSLLRHGDTGTPSRQRCARGAAGTHRQPGQHLLSHRRDRPSRKVLRGFPASGFAKASPPKDRAVCRPRRVRNRGYGETKTLPAASASHQQLQPHNTPMVENQPESRRQREER